VLRESEQTDSATRLGARVRTLRRERGLTLKALGRSAGLSHPFLSQLERGLARPSVSSVERIAHALEVPVRALWASPGTEPRLIRAAEGAALAADGEPLQVREWSGDRDWTADAETAPGTVLVYVIRGAIELELDGTIHALSERDALLFDGTAPHRMRRTGGAGTRALYVATV
jgi:transcriptional regulator with XRE-family HTH domain